MSFQLPTFEFYQRLSTRERRLTLAVGGVALVLLNLIAISTLLSSSRTLRAEIAAKSQELRLQNLYAQEQSMWKQRTAWLRSKQPPLINRDRAGTDLLGEIQAAARANRVVMNTFQIRPVEPPGAVDRVAKPEYQPVSVHAETQSDWAALVQFVAALQQPEGFVVFDSATLRSDPGDAQRMKGEFNVSKWYATGAK